MQFMPRHCGISARFKPVKQCQHSVICRRESRRLRQGFIAIFGNHRQAALRQIANIIGQIGINAIDNRLI